MKKAVAILILLFLAFSQASGAHAAPRMEIQVQHHLRTDPETGKVKGIRIQSRLETSKPEERIQGSWTFRYPVYQRVTVTGKDGRKRWVQRERVVQSRDGEVLLPMKHPGERRITVQFRGEIRGKPVQIRKVYPVEVPRIRIWADKEKGGALTTIQATVTGNEKEGKWFLAVARRGGQIIRYTEGDQDPRLTVRLKEDRYLLRAVFRGKVDGAPLAMQETKRLEVENLDSDTFVIHQLNNQTRTAEEAERAVKGMKESGWLSNWDRDYADRNEVIGWGGGMVTALTLCALLMVRRNRKRGR